MALRLLAAALILILAVLPVAGVVLAYNFSSAVTTAFDERLTTLLNAVVARAAYDPAEDEMTGPESLGDPRFDRVYSGWYWQISSGGEVLSSSRSLWDQRLPVFRDATPTVRDGIGPRDAVLRVASRTVRLAALDDPVHISVAMPRAWLDEEINEFNWLLAGSLAGLGLLLLAALTVQIRWGLAPLRRLQADVHNVEIGERERLGTDIPDELARLAGAMNTVLDRDKRLIERGRRATSNLAHALKTPLGVLRAISPRLSEPERQQVEAEIGRLDNAVRHHLSRASAAGASPVPTASKVTDALAPVINGMERLAVRRGLRFSHQLRDECRVRIEAEDLQELTGNLLENAFKWANTRVSLEAAREGEDVVITVNDDGPGMTPPECEAALVRGTRLDETTPGDGLGLAIVRDLISEYGGELALERSTLGGLEAALRLPGVGTPKSV